ncbi:MAG: hypothetical protein ACI9EZ_000552 [Halobacteriales archaeon]
MAPVKPIIDHRRDFSNEGDPNILKTFGLGR